MDENMMELDTDFVKWLEDTVRGIYEAPPESVLVMTISPDGDKITTSTYSCSDVEMALFEQELRRNEIRKMMKTEAAEIRALLDEESEEPEE